MIPSRPAFAPVVSRSRATQTWFTFSCSLGCQQREDNAKKHEERHTNDPGGAPPSTVPTIDAGADEKRAHQEERTMRQDAAGTQPSAPGPPLDTIDRRHGQADRTTHKQDGYHRQGDDASGRGALPDERHQRKV